MNNAYATEVGTNPGKLLGQDTQRVGDGPATLELPNLTVMAETQADIYLYIGGLVLVVLVIGVLIGRKFR